MSKVYVRNDADLVAVRHGCTFTGWSIKRWWMRWNFKLPMLDGHFWKSREVLIKEHNFFEVQSIAFTCHQPLNNQLGFSPKRFHWNQLLWWKRPGLSNWWPRQVQRLEFLTVSCKSLQVGRFCKTVALLSFAGFARVHPFLPVPLQEPDNHIVKVWAWTL